MSTTTLSTAGVIAGMLKKNTGVAMCDSGGAGGRHYQRNQERDFASEPAITLDFRYESIDVTLNLYHWLAGRLEFAPELQADFDAFNALPENVDDYWAEVLDAWREARGAEIHETINSCNGEDLLSQTIQWWHGELDGEDFIILQIHGGADVRCGYTAPKFFTPDDDCLLYDNARAIIVCERTTFDPAQLDFGGEQTHQEPHNWDTDDAYHWSFEGCYGNSDAGSLEKYDFSDKPADKGNGKLYVDEDGNGYCPLCGSKLNAYA